MGARRVVLMTGFVATMFAAVAVAASGIGGAEVSERADRVQQWPRTFSVVATGDWLPENRINAAAASAAIGTGVRYDHLPLLEPVVPIIRSASLAICHMETPIGLSGAQVGFIGRSPGGRTLISAPFEVAADLRRAGFDRCSTASNHSYDAGVGGIDSTLAALDAAGVTHTGTARSPDEDAPDVFEVDGVAVSHLSFARNSNTGWPREAWRVNRLETGSTVVQDVVAARAAGADVVIVSIHVFVEMKSEPSAEDRALIDAITRDARVDLVVAHGPHVIQPMEIVNGTPVFWSLGNFVSGMGVPGRGRYSDLRALDGLMASARFTERSDGGFDVVAAPILLCQRSTTRVVYPGVAAQGWAQLPAGALADIRACVDRSTSVVSGLR